MLYIQSTLSLICLALLFTLLGSHIKSRVTSDLIVFPSVLVGFVAYLALFQVIALPFLVTHANPRFFFGLVGAVTLCWAIVAIRSAPTNRGLLITLRRYATDKYIVGIVLIILAVVTLSLATTRYDIDDSFYLGMAADNISSARIYEHDPATGAQDYPMISLYGLGSYELFIAFVSIVSNLPVAIIAHFVLAVFLIALFLISHKTLLDYLFLNKDRASVAFIFFIVALLFAGSSPYLSSNFILARPWQGKSLLIGMFVPVFMVLTARFLDKDKKNNSMLLFTQILFVEIAAFACSPVTIFILPIFLLGISVAKFLKDKKVTIPIAKDVFLILLPLVIAAVVLKIFTQYSGGQIEQSVFAEITTSQWKTIAKGFYGASLTGIVVFFIFLILIFQQNFKTIRYTFAGLLISFLIVANPAISGVMSKQITTTATYWRLFWITVPELAIAVFCTWFFVSMSVILIKNRKKYVTSAILSIPPALIIITLGSYMFQTKNGFSLTQNIYKTPAPALEATNFPRGSKILADDLTSAYLRSINPYIITAYSRPTYMSNVLVTNPGRLKELNGLSEIINGRIKPDQDFYKTLKAEKITYIIYLSSSNNLRDYTYSLPEFKIVNTTSDYTVQQVL